MVQSGYLRVNRYTNKWINKKGGTYKYLARRITNILSRYFAITEMGPDSHSECVVHIVSLNSWEKFRMGKPNKYCLNHFVNFNIKNDKSC